jgi:hypothetical protein
MQGHALVSASCQPGPLCLVLSLVLGGSEATSVYFVKGEIARTTTTNFRTSGQSLIHFGQPADAKPERMPSWISS